MNFAGTTTKRGSFGDFRSTFARISMHSSTFSSSNGIYYPAGALDGDAGHPMPAGQAHPVTLRLLAKVTVL